MVRDFRAFAKFSLLGVIPAMIFGVTVLDFINKRFSAGAARPVGQAAGWAERAATGR